MRLDLFMKWTGLYRQRTEAKRACDRGEVSVDGEPAKASSSVRPGTRILIEASTRLVEAEVAEIPTRAPSKSQRQRFVRLLRQERRDAVEADLSF
jgi:ribosomal 50S subunit-recycling heat shock protein